VAGDLRLLGDHRELDLVGDALLLDPRGDLVALGPEPRDEALVGRGIVGELGQLLVETHELGLTLGFRGDQRPTCRDRARLHQLGVQGQRQVRDRLGAIAWLEQPSRADLDRRAAEPRLLGVRKHRADHDHVDALELARDRLAQRARSVDHHDLQRRTFELRPESLERGDRLGHRGELGTPALCAGGFDQLGIDDLRDRGREPATE
jgi:hypothetical protein